MNAVVDVDDLISVDQIEKYLVPIKNRVPDFRVTAYTVPNKFGPVHQELRRKYPWVIFGIHGWEHTHFECLTWTEEEALWYIRLALEMGYDQVFKAPNWVIHDEIVKACVKAGVVLHHHEKTVPTGLGARLFPGPFPRSRDYASIHTHILKNPSTDHIEAHPLFLPENLVAYDMFETPQHYARVS